MYKAILALLLVLALPIAVSAVDVNDAYQTISDESEAPAIVVSDNAQDTAAAIQIKNDVGVAATTPATTTIAITGDAVIVGGPCANPQWTEITGDTCESWRYAPGEAVIAAQEGMTANETVVLIAGTNAEDTRAAVDWFIANPDSAALNADVLIINVEDLAPETNETTSTTPSTSNQTTTTATSDKNCGINPADNTLTVDDTPDCATVTTSDGTQSGVSSYRNDTSMNSSSNSSGY